MKAFGPFDDDEAANFLDYLRFGSSPGSLEAVHRMNKEIDVRLCCRRCAFRR